MMDFSQFAFWLLCGLLSIAAIILGWFLNGLLTEIKGIRAEMAQFNEKLAHVVTNQDWHGKELERLDERVKTLEKA